MSGPDTPEGRRVAVVTGGTRGLGRLVALSLAADGLHVVALYASDEASALAVEVEATRLGTPVATRRVDLTDAAACEGAVSAVLDRYGRIDHLVNNAGIMRDGTMASMQPDDWDAVIQVDLSAVFYITRAVLPPMVRAGFGRIVMIGSAAGVTGSPARPAYATAKAGLLGLTRSIAQGYGRDGVTANLVVVGPTTVGMGEATDERSWAALVRLMPTGRPVEAGDVVHAVRFLIDDRAGSVTGSTVTVDGGMTM